MLYRTANKLLIRNLLAISLLGLSLALAGCAKPAADQALTTTGASVSLAGDNWLVVNYWAEWCGPCRHEIPELNELDDALLNDSEGSPAVTVLGVNYDGLRDQKLADVGERMGIEFAVLADDPRQRWAQESPTVLPSTYLIAPGGEFIETLVGPQTRAGILSRIQSLAKQRQEQGKSS